MIQVRTVETNTTYAISKTGLAYYEIGVYDRIEDAEIFYIEFFFNGERRLKFQVNAGIYNNRQELEYALEFNKGFVIVSKEL